MSNALQLFVQQPMWRKLPYHLQNGKKSCFQSRPCRSIHPCGARQQNSSFSTALSNGQSISETTSHLPRLAQSSLWETIFPRSIRQQTKNLFRPPEKRPSNPASYFIWIYILIGSQAIRILGVKNESAVYLRKADLQIAKLREVIGKLQRGEDVDVEKTLGTGDDDEEQEWQDALREIEREDRAWQISKREKQAEKQRKAQEQENFQQTLADASPINESVTGPLSQEQPGTPLSSVPIAPGFY